MALACKASTPEKWSSAVAEQDPTMQQPALALSLALASCAFAQGNLDYPPDCIVLNPHGKADKKVRVLLPDTTLSFIRTAGILWIKEAPF